MWELCTIRKPAGLAHRVQADIPIGGHFLGCTTLHIHVRWKVVPYKWLCNGHMVIPGSSHRSKFLHFRKKTWFFHWDGDSWCFGDFHLLKSSGSFCLIKPVPALWLGRLLTWSAPPNLQRCLSSFVARNELCSAGIDAAWWFGEHRWLLGRSCPCALLCCLVRIFIGAAWSHVYMCRAAARQSAGSIKAVWHRLSSLSCSLGAMALELHVMWEHDAW